MTPENQDSSHLVDSKATLLHIEQSIGPGNYPKIEVQAHTSGENDHTFDIDFLAAPKLSLNETHQPAEPIQTGQQIDYTLNVTNTSEAGPVLADSPISVVDTLPVGLTGIQTGGTNWKISRTGQDGGVVQIVAIYTGTYPVTAGTELPVITLSGTPGETASSPLTNTASVSATNDAGQQGESITDSITLTQTTPTPTPLQDITPTPTMEPTSLPVGEPQPTPVHHPKHHQNHKHKHQQKASSPESTNGKNSANHGSNHVSNQHGGSGFSIYPGLPPTGSAP